MASTDMEKGYQQGGPPLCLDPTSINLGPHSQAIHDTKEPPKPTNETLYERVKAAKTQSHGIVFLKEFFTILIGSMASMIIIGLFMAIPVGMIVIGSIHLNHCPAENLIPVFLLVGGSVWTIQCTVALVQTCCCPNSKETKGEEEKKKLHPFEALVNTFMACWFMAGTVWVYRTYGNFDSDPKSGNYCDHTLYSFAFCVVMAPYIMFGSLCCCCRWCITLGG